MGMGMSSFIAAVAHRLRVAEKKRLCHISDRTTIVILEQTDNSTAHKELKREHTINRKNGLVMYFTR
jgi:hypothetical protein